MVEIDGKVVELANNIYQLLKAMIEKPPKLTVKLVMVLVSWQKQKITMM